MATGSAAHDGRRTERRHPPRAATDEECVIVDGRVVRLRDYRRGRS